MIDERVPDLCHMHKVTFLLQQPNMKWIAIFNGEKLPDLNISAESYSVDEAISKACDRLDEHFDKKYKSDHHDTCHYCNRQYHWHCMPTWTNDDGDRIDVCDDAVWRQFKEGDPSGCAVQAKADGYSYRPGLSFRRWEDNPEISTPAESGSN